MSATINTRVEFAELATRLHTEFHKVFGHPIRTEPTLVSEEEAKLHAALLEEETNEYLHTLETADIVELADALGDIVVIATGTTLVYGLNLPALVRSYRGYRSGLVGAVAVACDAATGLDELGAALAAVVVLAYGEAAIHGIPLRAVFEEIHASNMTKLAEDGSVIRREDGKILKGPGYRPPQLAPILTMAGLTV